jgi:hypothetical protein
MYRNRFRWARRLAVIRALQAIAVVVGIVQLIPSVAYGHGVVGDRTFISPIVGNDAFPDNALSLTARRSNYDFSLLPELEKLLSDHSSLLLITGWDQLEQKGSPDPSGSRDLTIFFRQSVYLSAHHELEVTVSPFVVAPTGNRQIADQGYAHLGGELLLAKGMGDLPDDGALKYLRPFAIQTEAGYAGRVQGPENSDMFANFEVEYSLSYLNRYVRPLDVGHPWVDLVPYTQFNYSQALIASRLTTLPDFRITPGLAYLGRYYEVSVGAQLAINGAAQPGDRGAVIGLIEVFYDDIFPALAWQPF